MFNTCDVLSLYALSPVSISNFPSLSVSSPPGKDFRPHHQVSLTLSLLFLLSAEEFLTKRLFALDAGSPGVKICQVKHTPKKTSKGLYSALYFFCVAIL